MKKKVYFSFVIVALSFVTVKTIQKVGVNQYHYLRNLLPKELGIIDFKHPEYVISLPFELRDVTKPSFFNGEEISFLSPASKSIFAFNTSDFSFKNWGLPVNNNHFIGLSVMDSSFYVIQNDFNFIKRSTAMDSTEENSDVALNVDLNTELNGFCTDYRMNRLLICEKMSDENSESKIYGIYTLDIHTNQVADQPLFTIDPEELDAFAKSMEAENRIGNKKAMHAQVEFKPCSISVNPKSDEIFVLSSKTNTLAVFAKNGQLKTLYDLDLPSLKNVSDITFMQDGDLVIIDKSFMGATRIVKFNWQSVATNNSTM